ncbi:choice-of-anchor I domain-containing protein [Calothrix sp. CCY 0018]|uniref:choice-of-anchor I domain-containing protein n=1 Tax=Calothrix sp. CCY 0018 TaxID=3103864 RepID=UPI0039C7272A
MADIFISEYVEGSSNNKAIELYNPTDTEINFGTDNYTIELYSNGASSPNQTLNLTGTIASKDVFVITRSNADATIQVVADVTDADGVINFNGDDAIVIKKNGAVVDVIGQIGFDPGDEWGSGDASTQNNTIRRKESVTTGDTNPSDAFDPSLEWDGFAQDTFNGLGSFGSDDDNNNGASAVKIYEIQGAAHKSPLVGESVTTTGIVTAVDSNGFYLQDATGDNNNATSDAIFVFTSSAPSVIIGDDVEVSGTVSEFFPGGADTGNLSTTQISSSNVTVNSSGNSLPAATIIGTGGRIPPTENIDDDAFGSFDADTDGIDFFESLEGMRVTAKDAVAVAPTNSFGEIFTVVDNGENATGISERGTLNISPDDFNPERVQINEDSDILPGFDIPEVDVGAKLGDVTGVVGYGFGNFEIYPTQEFTVTPSTIAAETTNLMGSADKLTVASYNVLNLDPKVEDVSKVNRNDTDEIDDDEGNGRFTKIASQIVNNLKTPDIIGLQEIQDNTGAEINDGVTSASETLQKLVDAIATAGGPTYSFIDNTFIGENTSGGQPGGNIRTAFLYNPERVGVVEGSVETIEDNGFNGSRLPLVAKFSFNGEEVTVVNNHFSSKGGSAPILGVKQPFEARQEDVNVNGSLDERQAQAEAVKGYVDEILAENNNANVVVLGDLNEFEFVSPVETLAESLTNLTETLPENERYSFNFQGNSQSLDHILVSDNLEDNAEFDIVHVNSEFADTDEKASDHDPLVASLSFSKESMNKINLSQIGTFTSVDGAEIVAYDPTTQRLFVTTGDTVEIIDISNPANPTKFGEIDLTTVGGGSNSVAVNNGIVAVAVEADTAQDPGIVAFYNTDGELLKTVTVGALPDMLTFTPDGTKVIVANEGEPNDDYTVDPEGSISIIDISGGVANLTDANVTNAFFTGFNDRKQELINKGVRIFGETADGTKATVAQDLEPEYIAVSADGSTAVVTLQENNAIAVVNIETATVQDILPLGFKDYSKGQPTLTQYQFSNLPVLGTTATTNPEDSAETTAGQDILLGGLSGLFYDGTADNGNLKFVTVPDRGPNGNPTNVDDDDDNERPFALPDYQARVVKFELNETTGAIENVSELLLTRKDGTTPITGRPNIAGVDEEPVDLFGNLLGYDKFGADLEGVVINPADGSYWMVDEYRPAIYNFDSTGKLIERFVPSGTGALGNQAAGTYGAETLPEEYSNRLSNRGFEAVALDTDASILYAFIQTPLANPDGDTSDNSDVIRILGINPTTGEPVAEYVYLLEDPAVRSGGRVDKIGDAAYVGDGKFQVIERDSAVGANANKFLIEIDLKGATNLLAPDAPALMAGMTLEQYTASELVSAGINPVNKIKVTNLPSIGYQAGDKPEGLALLPDGRLAVLNDNDFGLLDEDIPLDGTVPVNPNPIPVVLGIIDFAEGNKLDASNEDDGINIKNHPVFGMYQPDAIDSFEVDGKTYYITANEGDARIRPDGDIEDADGNVITEEGSIFNEETRIKDVTLDPTVFPNAEELQQDENLGRLKITNTLGDLDGDGDFDKLFSYGGRSFSIWDGVGNLVFDSGDQIAQITAEQAPELFNANDGDPDEFDDRSDDKGAEPESVTVGIIDGKPYGFVGLERGPGGVLVYDLSKPTAPEFIQYIRTEGDIAPEGLKFIAATDSPNGNPLLAVANEESKTTTLYDIEVPQSDTYSLQILHASDLEGGVDAIDRAANFAAIVDYLEDEVENSITLSAGDNYLSGPFFSAAGDLTFRDDGVFNNFYNDYYDLPQDVENDSDADSYGSLREGGGRVDISIMNAIGFDASALGNHEFDLGTDAIEDIISPDYGDAEPELSDDRWVGSQFPYLSANLDFSDSNLNGLYTGDILPSTAFESGPEESLAGTNVPKIAPATVIEEGGEKIGVVGATTPLLRSISSPGDVKVLGSGNDMDALAAVLQPYIDQLVNDQGVNKVVLVSHLQQIALEKELIGKLSGVDVVIAGGSDTLQADSEDVARGLNPGDTSAEDYPFVTTNKDGDTAVIISTDGEYSYVGRLVVDFDAEGKVIADSIDENVSGAFATTSAQVQALWGNEDPFADQTKGELVKQLTDAVDGIVTAKDSNIFGETDVFLEGRRGEVRTEETNLGNLTADANLAYAKEVDPSVTVSIKNGGGIRAPIGFLSNDGEELPTQENPGIKEEGEVSQLDIENSLRFNNELSLLTVTAAELKQILEYAVAASGDDATPGQFPQVGGLKFSFDTDNQAIELTRDADDNATGVATEGDRIQSLAILDEDGDIQDVVVQDGEVVGDANREIRLVTLNFLAGGGDGYPFSFFGENRVDLTEQDISAGDATFAEAGTEQDALAEYLLDNFSETAFDIEDVPVAQDMRIQNLDFREDTVLEGLVQQPPVGENTIAATTLADGTIVESIDLSGFTGQATVNYTISREADFDNEVYFYKVDDINGSVNGIAVGEAGYLQAALARLASPQFSTSDNNTENGSVTFDAGSIVVPLIIADGNLSEALSGAAEVYFLYLGANTDNGNFDHIKLLDDNTFGFEDLPNGGDEDFNDIVIKIESIA